VAVDLQKAIARLKPAQVRTIIDAALRVEPDDFDDLPAPQVMLRGDGWTGVTTTIDGDGYRAVLITAGGRRTSSRTCTVIDPEGATIGAFSADDAARLALATAAGLLVPRLVGTGPITLGVLGAGPLARRTIAELPHALPLGAITIHDPDPTAAAAAAEFGRVVGDAATAVRDARLVLTATNARDPALRADWVAPGASIIALGADRRGRRELDYRLLADAAFVTCDAPLVARVLADDLRECVEEGHLDWQEITPLRDVLIGAADARVTADDLVVAKLIDATPGVLALARAALKL
jgi:ornithine cyclodeaminase